MELPLVFSLSRVAMKEEVNMLPCIYAPCDERCEYYDNIDSDGICHMYESDYPEDSDEDYEDDY